MIELELEAEDTPDEPTSGVQLVSERAIEDDFPAFPWDRERLYRLRVWRQYERETRESGNEPPTYEGDHLVDEAEIEAWTNEVLAELRAGRRLVDAIDMANREEDESC